MFQDWQTAYRNANVRHNVYSRSKEKVHPRSTLPATCCPPQSHKASLSCVPQGVMPNVPSSKGHRDGFAIQHMLKDLHLATDAAAHAHARVPLTERALDVYAKVRLILRT